MGGKKTTWNMKLLVNWIRCVFCDFDMFADWKSFGLRVNGLLTWIRLIDMSVNCIEGIALMFGVIAEIDATVETIWRNIGTQLTILRQINWLGIEMPLKGGIANVIVCDLLHLISCTLSDVIILFIVCAIRVTTRTVMAHIEWLLRIRSRW